MLGELLSEYSGTIIALISCIYTSALLVGSLKTEVKNLANAVNGLTSTVNTLNADVHFMKGKINVYK